jgi:hypothetical protein
MRFSRRMGCLIALVAIGSALSFAAVGGQRGWGGLQLPEIDLNLGVARLVMGTTILSLCAQQMPCMTQHPSPVVRIHTAWLFLPPAPGQSPQIVKLFTISQHDLGR